MKNGKLLLFIMELLVPKLNFPPFSHIKEKLRQPLEQVIFCLYGHPSKFISGIRSKPRYLDEHVKTTIALTWEKSQLLFEFYKPGNFPSFVSRKNDSINLDTVVLFKKICHLVPSDSDPFYKLEDMNAFLLGNREDIPRVEKIIGNGISYIYYLIADHYFKASSNQSWENAIKYYMLDLCLHPEELNSWAGLAMSTSTQMETWLNNFYPDINEEKYLMKAKISRRSYQQAVKLSPLHVTIWTEFGHFLYTVHSFCSRLLKQESDSLSMEKFKTFETQKEEMLDESRDCFLTAELVYLTGQAIDEPQDERWLYQYMLAKIAEKKKEEPPNFLKYYSNWTHKKYQIAKQQNARTLTVKASVRDEDAAT
ncbi:calcineurin-binding protein cabin-1-like [Copidosoma floridanum]|uniref:calcineurin-binding protein cabin-1-like n=1 Tax=Copidosoma floridanum TaxID=29053 RepID=UPI0006C9D87A|nr:calcineurin-binding protein cabin-1-like [Copidosoma floridanum]